MSTADLPSTPSSTRVTRTHSVTGRRTVAGLFRDREDAERAVRELKDVGFSGDQIGIVMRDRTAQGELVEQTGTHAAAGAVSGLVGGGLLGGLVGFLLGIGALAIPGIGPVVAGGALATALGVAGGTAAAGAGIGAAAGGIVGALIGMGIPETEARHFEAGVRSGGVLVTVDTRGRADLAADILDKHGADLGIEGSGVASTTTTTTSTTSAAPERVVDRPADRDDTPATPVPGMEVERPEGVTAQQRAERAIEESFVRHGDGHANAYANEGRTGTSDVTYNLVSVIYHALQGVDTYEAYVRDAEQEGDRELARFLRDVQEENRRRAARAKELLRERLSSGEGASGRSA